MQVFFSLSSVDGEKLYHGFAIESSESKRSRQSNKDQCSDGCPCGTNEGQPNDINALCAAMLRAHGVKESLSAAYVSFYIISIFRPWVFSACCKIGSTTMPPLSWNMTLWIVMLCSKYCFWDLNIPLLLYFTAHQNIATTTVFDKFSVH